MAWIEVHQELREHPKTKRLCQLLAISPAHAVGHLVLLWHWALDFAQNGDVTCYSAQELATAAGWTGPARDFVRALERAHPPRRQGFLERRGTSLLIHDWEEYAGKLIDQRLANANRQQRFRERRRNALRNATTQPPLPLRNDATGPDPTGPDPTGPDPTGPDPTGPDQLPPPTPPTGGAEAGAAAGGDTGEASVEPRVARLRLAFAERFGAPSPEQLAELRQMVAHHTDEELDAALREAGLGRLERPTRYMLAVLGGGGGANGAAPDRRRRARDQGPRRPDIEALAKYRN